MSHLREVVDGATRQEAKGLLKTGGRMTSGTVCAFLQAVWLHWCRGGVGGKRSNSAAFPVPGRG